ncbi:MAG: Rab family GTPase [Candidatus Odinarchaeota archaeon]
MTLRQYLKKTRNFRKVLLLGSGAVGKTSIVKVLKEHKSLEDMKGSHIYHRTAFLELESVKTSELIDGCIDDGVFQLWDLAGQSSLPVHATRDIANTTLGSVDLVLLVFASDNIQTLIEIVHWMTVVRNYYKACSIDKEPDYVLIRNKTDIESTINQGLIDHVLRNESQIIDYFEISCMTGNGLDRFKEWLVNHFF